MLIRANMLISCAGHGQLDKLVIINKFINFTNWLPTDG